jgi:hypothetical protein
MSDFYKLSEDDKKEQRNEYYRNYRKEKKTTVDKELEGLNEKLDLLYNKLVKNTLFQDELMEEEVMLTDEEVINILKELNEIAKAK